MSHCLEMFWGTLGGLLSCQKQFQGIRRNCGQKVHFGCIRWIRPN